VAVEDLARGMMLAERDALEPVRKIDVRLQLLPGAKALKHLARVHLHCFASESVAQVRLLEDKQLQPGSSMLAQLQTAEPLLVVAGDRFIIRQFSPVITIGGGVVLDAFPVRRTARQMEAAREFLQKVEHASPLEALHLRVQRRGMAGLLRKAAVKETGHTREAVDFDAQKLIEDGMVFATGDLLLSKPAGLDAAKQLLAEIDNFHKANPLIGGIAKETLRGKVGLGEAVFSFLLAQLSTGKKVELQSEQVRLAGRGVSLSAEEQRAQNMIEHVFSSAGLKVPLLKDVLASLSIDRTRSQKIVTLLLREGILVKLGDELVFHRSALEQLRRVVLAEKSKAARIDVGRFKDLLGVTRKYAIPLLEYLDRERVTRRVGDAREIL
jgi:selenocysteine-specific elongation factor